MGALEDLLAGKANTTTVGTTGGDVYLGSTKYKASVTTSPTGGTYNIPAGATDNTSSILDAKNQFYNWTEPELNGFINRLSSYGFKGVNRVTAKSMWDMAVDGASSWYRGSGGKQKVTPEQYLQWNSKGQGDTAALPQKQVYLYDKATIQGVIDDTLTSVLGRKATADENKQFYTAIQGMINEGTVTTTKTVVDKATGKKVSQSTTTPGFTKEKATAMIEEELKTNASEDYLQKKSLDFADFLSQLGA
jgi:hypothetical protein